jgi:hypothetical protein
MLAAKIHAKPELHEDVTPREKGIAYSQMTWRLTFKDYGDEARYMKSLKNLFFFPTFWPIIIVFTIATITQSGIVRQLSSGDGFLACSFAINMLNFTTIFIYTCAQFVDFFRIYMPKRLYALARWIVGGRLEDFVVILSTIAQGVYQLSLVSRDICASCTSIFEVEKCSNTLQRSFPINQTFFAYVSLLMLPVSSHLPSLHPSPLSPLLVAH